METATHTRQEPTEVDDDDEDDEETLKDINEEGEEEEDEDGEEELCAWILDTADAANDLTRVDC